MRKMTSKNILSYPASDGALALYNSLGIDTDEQLRRVVAYFQKVSVECTLQVTSYKMKNKYGHRWSLDNCLRFRGLLESVKKSVIWTKTKVFHSANDPDVKKSMPIDESGERAIINGKKLALVSADKKENRRRKKYSNRLKQEDLKTTKTDISSGSSMQTSPASPLKLLDKHGRDMKKVFSTSIPRKAPNVMHKEDQYADAIVTTSNKPPESDGKATIGTETLSSVLDAEQKGTKRAEDSQTILKILVKFLHRYAFWPIKFSASKSNTCADVLLGVDKEFHDEEMKWIASIKTYTEESKDSPCPKIKVVKDGFDLANQLVKFLSKNEQFAKLDIQVEYEPPFFRTDQSPIYTTALIWKHDDGKYQDNKSAYDDNLCLRSRYKISKFGNPVFWNELKKLREKVESNVVSKDVKLI